MQQSTLDGIYFKKGFALLYLQPTKKQKPRKQKSVASKGLKGILSSPLEQKAQTAKERNFTLTVTGGLQPVIAADYETLKLQSSLSPERGVPYTIAVVWHGGAISFAA
eukprot:RCo039424